MRWLLIGLVTVVAATPMRAQLAQPVAVRIQPARAPLATPREIIPIDTASNQKSGSIWSWIVIGSLLGGVAGGIWAGVEISHQDDIFIPELAIGMGVSAGLVGGGLLGALAYGVYHAPRESRKPSS